MSVYLTTLPEDIFKKMIKVSEEDRLHGLSGILEKKLIEAGLIGPDTSPHKKHHMISTLEEALEQLGPDKLGRLGFSSGSTRIVRAGDKLKLSVLKQEMYRLI